MGSNSGRRSGSSGRSTSRKRVVIGAEETVRVRYGRNAPHVESERKPRTGSRTPELKSAKRSSGAGKRLAKTKRAERERRQQNLRVRRTAVLVGIGAIAVAVVVGLIAIYRAPIFTVDRVVVSGNRHYTKAQVLDLARVPQGATLLRLPSRSIRKGLLADPWITSVTLDRDFPHTLRLSIDERKPVAVIDGGGKSVWLASADGHWLGLRSQSDIASPVVRETPPFSAKAGAKISSREVVNSIDVIRQLSPDLLKEVAVITAPSVADTALQTKGDVEIFVGQATQMAEKDRIIKAILGREKGVVYINVRVTDRPTWRGINQRKTP